MKIKKRTTVIFTITAVLTLLYIILAAYPLNTEYSFTPEWTKDITTTGLSTVNKDEPVSYFKLGQSAGYFTSEGELLSSFSFPSKISISDKFYATYSTDAEDIDFFNNSGKRIGQLNAAGFPYFQDDRAYVFLPGGSSFSMFNEKGLLLWTSENVMPITAFSSNQDYTATGYSDGTIRITNNSNGSIVTEYEPSGSELNAILGLDISNDGKYTACISGHNQQRFIVSQTVNDRQKIIFYKYLDSDIRYRTLVKFNSNNTKVLYVYDKGIGIYDIRKKTNKDIPINDNIISIKETDTMYFLLGKTGKKYTVYIIEKTDKLTGSFTFEAENACIQTLNNNLYVGKDNQLSKIAIKTE